MMKVRCFRCGFTDDFWSGLIRREYDGKWACVNEQQCAAKQAVAR